jgi:hypothetical protein
MRLWSRIGDGWIRFAVRLSCPFNYKAVRSRHLWNLACKLSDEKYGRHRLPSICARWCPPQERIGTVISSGIERRLMILVGPMTCFCVAFAATPACGNWTKESKSRMSFKSSDEALAIVRLSECIFDNSLDPIPRRRHEKSIPFPGTCQSVGSSAPATTE